jgi:O-antigen biosynthesis protein
MDDPVPGSDINSGEYWNRRFAKDWIAEGGRLQTAFFAELCVRELPLWLIEEIRSHKSSIFDYGCAVGDALPILQRTFPHSIIRGGDIAEIGIEMARTLYPGFEFADIGAIGDTTSLADLVYCSNTLEHLTNWPEVLDRIARLAKEYIVVVVPFEEEDRIEEHVATFEFDTLPARLPGGSRLLHLEVVDAAIEPDSQWNGLQLIAIYGRKRRNRDRPLPPPTSRRTRNAVTLDLRGVKPSGIAPVLAGLAAISRAKRQMAAEAAQARAETERLEGLQAQTEYRNIALQATFGGAIREYADLVRGMEDAQGWVIDRLIARDPALLSTREIAPIADEWLGEQPDPDAAHRAVLARLIEAIHRTNRLSLAFDDQVTRWYALRAELTQRLQRARRAMERAVGDRDRAVGRALEAPQTTTSAPLVSIVLPVYNQAYLVGEAIAGVLSQSYEDWELIVVDDGSTDDLEPRIRQHLGDRRVLFLRQPNQRLPAALNHGFAQARGDFLTWTSADNIMLPSQLERLVAELAAYPDVGLVYSDYWAIDDRGEPLDDPTWRSHNRDPEIADLIRLPDAVTIENFHRSGDNFIGASFLYRRTVAAIVGSYADDAFGGEDYDFWLRMHLITEFRHVAEPLYKYRVHADTLTARADDLGLFANIRDLLEADRWRIETLLADGGLKVGGSLLRPVDQFHTAVPARCLPVAYRCFVERDPAATPLGPVVVDIDGPARAIDPELLRPADILLCRTELTAAMLRREDRLRGKRVLVWQGEPAPAVLHAYIQAFADQVTIAATAPVRRVPARIDDAFRPARLLIVVDRWSSGGMENIVIDLAESLVADGRTVIVAAADGAPPPAAAFANAPIRTVSFRGEESAFTALLHREAIEIVNYHHSRFAAGAARREGVATVYTMHNCYLWMDEPARAEVATGLGEMDRLIAVSRQVAQFAVGQFDYPADRIVVVPNGLRDELIAAATGSPDRFRDRDAPFTVAMVASLSRPKLQHIAIAAFDEIAGDIPPMRLRLIGPPLDPPYHEELQAQIAASPHRDRIDLVAGLTRTETIAALAAAPVFLLPSLVEGCSMALLEAAAAGCVCIASDVGNASELQTAGGAVVLLPSPLGELDRVTQQQFLAAARSELPEHRANIANALRTVWHDFGSFAAGAAETRARLRALCGMPQMTAAYLDAYTLARRGGPARRRTEAEAALADPV